MKTIVADSVMAIVALVFVSNSQNQIDIVQYPREKNALDEAYVPWTRVREFQNPSS